MKKYKPSQQVSPKHSTSSIFGCSRALDLNAHALTSISTAIHLLHISTTSTASTSTRPHRWTCTWRLARRASSMTMSSIRTPSLTPIYVPVSCFSRSLASMEPISVDLDISIGSVRFSGKSAVKPKHADEDVSQHLHQRCVVCISFLLCSEHLLD